MKTHKNAKFSALSVSKMNINERIFVVVIGVSPAARRLLRVTRWVSSVGYRLLGFGEELLNTGMTLLEKLRSSSEEWLESILRFIYNSGGFLVSF